MLFGASLMVQQIKNLPVDEGDIGEEGLTSGSGRSLEKGVATHSRILASKIPRTEEPLGLPSMGSQIVGHGKEHMVVVWGERHCLCS